MVSSTRLDDLKAIPIIIVSPTCPAAHLLLLLLLLQAGSRGRGVCGHEGASGRVSQTRVVKDEQDSADIERRP